MYDKQKVIDLALSERGYHEQGNNLTKYAADLDAIKGFYNGPKNGYAWCDVFVDWCFVKSYGVVGAKELLCQPDSSCGAGCSYSADYFRQHGQFYPAGSTPQTGDQIFFSYRAGEVSHTGIVVEVTAYSVATVEGNTSDMVAKRSYPLSDGRIYGYGRPDWGAGSVDEPQEGQGEIVVDPAESTNAPTKPVTDTNVGGKKTFTVEMHYLRHGDKGEDVRAMQGALIARKCSCGPWGADGDFGNDTENALRAFQNRNGLKMDGEYGPLTASKLLGLV